MHAIGVLCLVMAAALPLSSTAAATKPLLGGLLGNMPLGGNIPLLGNKAQSTKLAAQKQPSHKQPATGALSSSTPNTQAPQTPNPKPQTPNPFSAARTTNPGLVPAKPLTATSTVVPSTDAASMPAAVSVPNDGFYDTCTEALTKIPGYSYTSTALRNCPDLVSLQTDPSEVRTFFVPSNTAIERIARHIGLPVQLLIGPTFKGVMCNFLKYHIADNKNMLEDWQVGQALTTAYGGAQLTIVGVDTPQIKTKNGVVATVERVATCGSSVAYGIDEVLAPIAVPHLG